MSEWDGQALVRATYRVRDKASALERRAEGIAVGLTVGSWTDLPEARQASVRRHCGRVEEIRVMDEAVAGGGPASGVPAAGQAGQGNPTDEVIAELTIGYPVENFTDTVAALLTTVFGKLSMDGEIRLSRLQLPDVYASRFPGPKFGVSGVRSRLNVEGRPLLMSIFKACVGRDVENLTEAFRQQALGGADLIKDDEIFFNESYATPEARVVAYRQAADRVYAETGHRAHYAVNLTGPAHQLQSRARRLAELGADALLINALAYGYDLVADLARDSEVPIPLMIHPAVSGAFYGSATHGIASDIVLGQLMRLVGADIVIYPSPYGSVTLAREEGLRLVDALRRPGPQRVVLPAPSAGIHPGLVPKLVADLGTDCIVNAGGAIHGHPSGSTAGGKAFRAAIDATVAGQSLTEAALTSPELQSALEKWGTGQ